MSRETVRFALPPSLVHIGAGDVVTLDGEEQGVRFRIDRLEQAEMQLADAVRIEPGIYAPSDLPDDRVSTKPFIAPVPVFPVFLDLPLLTGSEVPHAPYIAVTADPWPGSAAVYSATNDEDYALQDVISAQAVIGTTQTPLRRASVGLWDDGAPLRVRLVDGLLESRPRESLLNGANLAAIGDGTPGNWELFQFATASLEDQGGYALSGRLRGQLGTDAAMPDVWPDGSTFVLLDERVFQTGLLRSERRVTKNYRIGPGTRAYDDQSFVHQVHTFDGNGLRPYAPVHLGATATVQGDQISWIRRTRLDGDSWEGLDVPLGEETESYLLRILVNGRVVREQVLSEPRWTYAPGMKVADGVTGSYSVDVAQISASFGPGPSARVTVG